MIATILQRDPQSTRECVAVWRQLGDILAQRGMQLSDEEIHRSLYALAGLRSKIPENVRRDSALSIARHGRFAPLVALYANDVPSVAAAMLQHAKLPEEDWLALLPATGDVARSVLGGRQDLPEGVRRALVSLGSGVAALPAAEVIPEVAEVICDEEAADAVEHVLSEAESISAEAERVAEMDKVLAAATAEVVADWTYPEAFEQTVLATRDDAKLAPPPKRSLEDELGTSDNRDGEKSPVSQISELVRRIDKFQSARTSVPKPPKPEDMSAIEAEILAGLKGAPVPPRAPKQQLLQFQFETMADGVVCWAEGVAPQAIIGLSIADAALGTEPGTDGVAAGAFRQRAEIINARMRLGGSSDFSGEWRISADPIFDPATGQFRGYSGLARRPLRRETPYGQPVPHEAGDSIRQLIHELRSPLNAISGFAQIISGQMFGAVSGAYRKMADSIIEDAHAVQAIIEDLDTATGREGAAPKSSDSSEVVDLVDVFAFVSKDLQTLLADQRVGLSITEEGGPFMARAEEGNVRRMVGRLLTALIDISEPDSLLVAQLIADLTQDDMVQLRIVRPAAIRFADVSQLLDPGYSPDGEAPGADILSLGFSLRLVGSLAQANGGRLEIASNALILHLPLATAGSRSHLSA
jgi:signal transduction histidine kinase